MKKDMKSFATSDQIHELAVVACDAYELSCQWEKCNETITIHCAENFGFRPHASLRYAVINAAKAIWERRKIEACRAAFENVEHAERNAGLRDK